MAPWRHHRPVELRIAVEVPGDNATRARVGDLEMLVLVAAGLGTVRGCRHRPQLALAIFFVNAGGVKVSTQDMCRSVRFSLIHKTGPIISVRISPTSTRSTEAESSELKSLPSNTGDG
jgi:hypothetical protein